MNQSGKRKTDTESDSLSGMNDSKQSKSTSSKCSVGDSALKPGLKFDLEVSPLVTNEPKNPYKKLAHGISTIFDGTFPFICFVIGTTISGKTTSIINLLFQKKMLGPLFTRVIVCTPTAKQDENWHKVIEKKDNVFLYQELTPFVKKDLETQSADAKQNNDNDFFQALVIDDAVAGKQGLPGATIQNFSTVARHTIDALFFLSHTYKTSARTAMRSQIKCFIIMRSSPEKEREEIFKDVGSYFGSKDNLERLWDESIEKGTEDKDKYNFMFLNLCTKCVWKNLNELLYNGCSMYTQSIQV